MEYSGLMRKHSQKDAFTSPWSVKTRIAKLAFHIVWLVLCRWTPKRMKGVRLAVLAAFGARIDGRPFVDASVRIHFPWNLELGEKSCIARRVDVYNLDVITLGPRAVVAQDAMLCCGTHDFSSDAFELMTAPIFIGAGAFVGARAIILPGSDVADGTIVGAGAVLSGQTESEGIYAGNPARKVGVRKRAGPAEVAA